MVKLGESNRNIPKASQLQEENEGIVHGTMEGI